MTSGHDRLVGKDKRSKEERVRNDLELEQQMATDLRCYHVSDEHAETVWSRTPNAQLRTLSRTPEASGAEPRYSLKKYASEAPPCDACKCSYRFWNAEKHFHKHLRCDVTLCPRQKLLSLLEC